MFHPEATAISCPLPCVCYCRELQMFPSECKLHLHSIMHAVCIPSGTEPGQLLNSLPGVFAAVSFRSSPLSPWSSRTWESTATWQSVDNGARAPRAASVGCCSPQVPGIDRRIDCVTRLPPPLHAPLIMAVGVLPFECDMCHRPYCLRCGAAFVTVCVEWRVVSNFTVIARRDVAAGGFPRPPCLLS